MKLSFKYIFLFFALCLLGISCVEEQDFSQIDDLTITPEAEASILYIESPESSINAVGNADIISRKFKFDAFSSDVFADRVLDGSVSYITENTTSKAIDLLIELLDVEDNILDATLIESTPGMDSRTDISYGTAGKSINIIKNTSSIQVTAINNSGSESTSDLPDPKIILKSSGKFRLKIK